MSSSTERMKQAEAWHLGSPCGCQPTLNQTGLN